MRVKNIDSLDLPPLEPYRTLRRPEEHLTQGIFVAEGEKVVRRFLASDWQVVSLLLTQEWFDVVVGAVDASRLADAEVYVAEKSTLETIVGFRLHQGIMAVGRLPAEPPLEKLVPDSSSHLLVMLDGLEHAENVGAIVRNCAAFGADGILVGPTTASPYLRRAVRNSMGGIFKIPCVHLEQPATVLGSLRNDRALRIIIADAHAGQSIAVEDLSGNLCIVFGNEDKGVSREVEAIAAGRVAIPMENSMDSLNVASASAVFLYEVHKRRPREARLDSLKKFP